MASRWSGFLVITAVLFVSLFAAAVSGWAGGLWTGDLWAGDVLTAEVASNVEAGSLPAASLPAVHAPLAHITRCFAVALFSMGSLGNPTWVILRISSP